jgi:hypothetical protein
VAGGCGRLRGCDIRHVHPRDGTIATGAAGRKARILYREVLPALVSQLAEETDSKPVQCEFESHRGHIQDQLRPRRNTGRNTSAPEPECGTAQTPPPAAASRFSCSWVRYLCSAQDDNHQGCTTHPTNRRNPHRASDRITLGVLSPASNAGAHCTTCRPTPTTDDPYSAAAPGVKRLGYDRRRAHHDGLLCFLSEPECAPAPTAASQESEHNCDYWLPKPQPQGPGDYPTGELSALPVDGSGDGLRSHYWCGM